MSMTNEQVCHAWFHQQKNRSDIVQGKNAKGSIYYRHECIYSYGEHYMLAKIIMLPKPVGPFDRIVVRSIRRSGFGPTTTGHQNDVWSAIDRVISIIVTTDDAAALRMHTPADIISAVHTFALEEEARAASYAEKGWLTSNEIVAVQNAARALGDVYKAYGKRISKEAKAFIERVTTPDYEEDIIIAGNKARMEREAAEDAKKLAKDTKRIGKIVENLWAPLHAENISTTIMADYSAALRMLRHENTTYDNRVSLRDALQDFTMRVIGTFTPLVIMLGQTLDEYTNSTSPVPRVNLAILHGACEELQIDPMPIEALFNVLEDGAHDYFATLASNGKNGIDSRYVHCLHEYFNIREERIIAAAYGGEPVRIADGENNNPLDYTKVWPNSVIWHDAEKNRIMTSMSVAISVQEFKRYCRIIRALADGSMTVEDIPVPLRTMIGGYGIHSLKDNVITVGCHRLPMQNVTLLAEKLCS